MGAEGRKTAQPRLIAISRDGRYVAIRQTRGLDQVDALGTNPRRRFEIDPVDDFAFVGHELWVTSHSTLRRTNQDSGKATAGDFTMPSPGRLHVCGGSPTALLRGQECHLLVQDGDIVSVRTLPLEVEDSDFVSPLIGGRVAIARRGALDVIDRDGKHVGGAAYPKLDVGGLSELFAGRVIALHLRGDGNDTIIVTNPTGGMVHTVKIPTASSVVFSETRGLAIAHCGGDMVAVDLRYGRILDQAPPPLEAAAIAVDASGKYIAIAGFRADSDELSVLHLPYTSAFKPARKVVPTEEEKATAAARELQGVSAGANVDAAAVGEAVPEEQPAPPEPDEPTLVPDIVPRALGSLFRPQRSDVATTAEPYRDATEHLNDLTSIITARTARAIADAWDSGRLSLPSEDRRPFEKEVNALVGEPAGNAADAVTAADRRLAEIAEHSGQRAKATLAAGGTLPLFDITREFGLSRMAAQVLMVAAAPQLHGEIARLYGVLANDEGRPICDRFLIELVLGGNDKTVRNLVARELQVDSPLIRHGLVRVLPAAPDLYMFAPITVDPVLISRLRGNPYAGTESGAVTSIRHADRTIDELALPAALKVDIVTALAEPPADGSPVRVILRGRPGTGRTSLIAALAARVDRAVAVIDCERLPRRGGPLAERLWLELRRAALRGTVPCISNLELAATSQAEGLEHVREVLRSHPGPITFRTTPESRLPLEPGFIEFSIAPRSESDRLAFWEAALEQANLPVAEVSRLASRFRIGPGIIETVIATVKLRIQSGSIAETDDYGDAIDSTARQHIENRLSSVSSRVKRMASWDQVALPDDILDSIREFIGRVRQRRTVYEAWGFDRTMSSSRGLTALFYGPPGTGKTMVSGLIARELGLDLYRVDLARITSKWIGETEKNLSQVFDAAEDGQAVIVFDEADSLFAKRTEVKSSVDRYANLEVNYLLQRLDSFEGIAILTTNLEGSIDNAFKRRLSLRLAFPFPDEDMRVRLWSAHIPAELPTAGDFDFVSLAHKFPMSGGYIRNSTIRAAFLAAHEGVPLSQSHLERAIHLEYREMGKLSAGGRME